jgi:hypothetical protein
LRAAWAASSPAAAATRARAASSTPALALGAAYAVDAAREQAGKFSQENGGLGVTEVAWEALLNGSLFEKGLGGMFEVVDAKMNAKAQADAEAREKGTGDQQGKNATAMTAEDYTRALADANAKGIRVTNLGDIKLTPPPPTVGPGGRQPAPGSN